ncbi:uncharacterized protein LOC118570394 isoform X2 [Onychomys torridus]|uniref:uncharacterized protein LOC118570394 isoform X2 n=1 Tax=Onychomys torridus TaxID=38674 RepID=UPI00167F4234|nr:uncharacterized protein LOC118570394 isoform X2 [Onychomys torridus]
MVADAERREPRGTRRRPRRADGSGARARMAAKPRRSPALSRRACRELCVEGAGDCGRAATTGRRCLPPPLPVHLVHRALPRSTGRAPPAGRSPHPAGGFPLPLHPCPDQQPTWPRGGPCKRQMPWPEEVLHSFLKQQEKEERLVWLLPWTSLREESTGNSSCCFAFFSSSRSAHGKEHLMLNWLVSSSELFSSKTGNQEVWKI